MGVGALNGGGGERQKLDSNGGCDPHPPSRSATACRITDSPVSILATDIMLYMTMFVKSRLRIRGPPLEYWGGGYFCWK